MSKYATANAFLEAHGISDTPDYSEKNFVIYIIGFDPKEKAIGVEQSIDYLDNEKVINNAAIVIKKTEVVVWLYNDDNPVDYILKPWDFLWNGAMETEYGPYNLAKTIISDAEGPLEAARKAAEKKVAEALTDKV